jgi:nucleoside-diphosphate-sugar epimerase
MRIFIFGAGYSGKALARRMAGRAAAIIGTTRTTDKFGPLRGAGATPMLFDGEHLSPEVVSELARTTHLVVSAAPGDRGDPVLATAREAIIERMPAREWIGYLSTVGVYGDHEGTWVDEDSECRPTSRRSIQRVEAERDWMALGAARGVPVAVLRLSGIYGPGRNALVNLENGTARRIIRPGQVFNRIHVGDIAGALEHLGVNRLGGVYNVTDDLPAPPQDVVEFAASLMGVAPPPEVAYAEAEMTPMARSFWGENKRVSNKRIRSTGFSFDWPDFRVALNRMWSESSWKRSD